MLYFILYFFIYSFLFWMVQGIVSSVKARRLTRVGLLTSPFDLSGGFAAVVAVYFLEPEQNGAIAFIVGVCILCGVFEFFESLLIERILHITPWDHSGKVLEMRGRTCLLSAARGVPAALFIKYLHPHLADILSLIPAPAIVVISIVLTVLLLAYEMILIFGKQKLKERFTQTAAKFNIRKKQDKRVFAEGYNGYKLFFIFVIGAFIGDIIETIFVYLRSGELMSRSSLIYGQFSVVWGIGGVVLTIVLHSWSEKSDRYIFLGGLVIGGVYEYVCSVFTEYVFGVVFWDYSNIPFNINGRVNLLYCVFWGLLALGWVKGVYPRLSALIELIPMTVGRVLTAVLALFMIFSVTVTAVALTRYDARSRGEEPDNAVEEFIDRKYNDEYIEQRYKNLKGISS